MLGQQRSHTWPTSLRKFVIHPSYILKRYPDSFTAVPFLFTHKGCSLEFLMKGKTRQGLLGERDKGCAETMLKYFLPTLSKCHTSHNREHQAFDLALEIFKLQLFDANEAGYSIALCRRVLFLWRDCGTSHLRLLRFQHVLGIKV